MEMNTHPQKRQAEGGIYLIFLRYLALFPLYLDILRAFFFKARECGPVLISMATHPVIQHWLSSIRYIQYILNTAAFKNNFKRL